MKKAIYLFFTVSLHLFLTSCSTLLLIEKPLPPEIQLEPATHTLAFVNLFNYTLPSIVKEKNEETYRTAAINFMRTLNDSFSSDSAFHFIMADTMRKDIEPGNLTLLLPQDSVISLCRLYNADLLLTLDSLNLSITWDFEIIREDDGSKSRIKTFYLNSYFYLSLFNSSGNLIERSEVSKASIYKERLAISILITFKPSLANASNDAGFLATKAAEDYVNKFYPSTIKESRMLYTGKIFAESNSLIFRKDWNGAENLLIKIAENPDKNISRKAKYNLSVVSEARQFEK